jgi:hypothetical protein
LGVEGLRQRFLWTRTRPYGQYEITPELDIRRVGLKTPDIGRVCSDYPKGWAADAAKPCPTALQEKSARIREHAELIRAIYELSEAFEAGLKPLRMAA